MAAASPGPGGSPQPLAKLPEPLAATDMYYSAYGIFDPAPSLRLRWPNLPKGSIFFMRAIWKFYVVCPNATVHWFTPSGVRSITRHPLNQRETGSHEEATLEKICEKGVMVCMRGRPVLQQTGMPDQYHAVGAGTMTDQFYMAASRWPNNAAIQESLRSGLEDCITLTQSTPRDIVEYIILEHNNFHDGLEWNKCVLLCAVKCSLRPCLCCVL